MTSDRMDAKRRLLEASMQALPRKLIRAVWISLEEQDRIKYS